MPWGTAKTTDVIRVLFKAFSLRARERRARLFRSLFQLTKESRILDLGSERGDHIHSVLVGTPVLPENVYIADIDEVLINQGKEYYGFQPVLIPQRGRLPFDDDFFDVVYCSSVIEHVTVDKKDVWMIRSGKKFREVARTRQKEFAAEIMRLGKGYFVQTPYRFFPIESHSWLPFLGYLPRRLLMLKLRLINRFWVKRTNPDWYLLTSDDMKELFPDARILRERSMGLVKSLMAVRFLRGGS